jgi:glycosyltransferase involved in cell wall biosynthesis
MAKIIGNLICQDGIHEILRCIESVYPIVDEYHIVDGGSKDGTWEILNKYKKVYNLTLYQHPFEEMSKQRNWLLEKMPKDCWIVNIDQDEKLVGEGYREFIDRVRIEPHPAPIAMGMKFYNLIQDPLHHFENPVLTNVNKIFYNDKNLYFTEGYHSYITYDGEMMYVRIETPDDWKILHYAWLNPDRLKNIKKEMKSGKRDYQPEDIDFETRGSYSLT